MPLALVCIHVAPLRIGGWNARPSVPGKIDPGVLRHLGDEGVDHRPAHRLGVDGGEMRLRQDVAHDLGGLAGVDQVVDDQHALPAPAAELDDRVGHALEHAERRPGSCSRGSSRRTPSRSAGFPARAPRSRPAPARRASRTRSPRTARRRTAARPARAHRDETGPTKPERPSVPAATAASAICVPLPARVRAEVLAHVEHEIEAPGERSLVLGGAYQQLRRNRPSLRLSGSPGK